MFISVAQNQFDIHYLGLPYKIELSHYGFYAVMDADGECQISNFDLEGKILVKFFKMERFKESNKKCCHHTWYYPDPKCKHCGQTKNEAYGR